MLLRCVVVFVGSILQAQSAACMDHRDPRVSFETVIATKDPAKIRDKVVSLWPKGLCTVYIGLDTSIKESPKLQAFGAVDTSEKVGSHELNRRNQQAQLLQDYLILEVVYPAIEGRITAERAFATIDTLAGNPEGIFGDTRSQDTRCTIKTLKSLIYNRSPQLMDTAEATDPIIDTKKSSMFVRSSYKRLKYYFSFEGGNTPSMVNFGRSLDQSYAYAQSRSGAKSNLVGRKQLLWGGAVMAAGIAGCAYWYTTNDQPERGMESAEQEASDENKEPVNP